MRAIRASVPACANVRLPTHLVQPPHAQPEASVDEVGGIRTLLASHLQRTNQSTASVRAARPAEAHKPKRCTAQLRSAMHGCCQPLGTSSAQATLACAVAGSRSGAYRLASPSAKTSSAPMTLEGGGGGADASGWRQR